MSGFFLDLDLFVHVLIRIPIELSEFRLEFRLIDRGIITCFRNNREFGFSRYAIFAMQLDTQYVYEKL